MDSQQPRSPQQDELDLRWMVNVLVRRKLVILAFVGVGIAVAVVTSLFLTPSSTYKSSTVVALAAADGSDGVGMSLQGYTEFATGPQVMSAIGQKIASDQAANGPALAYDIQTDQGNRRLTVTAEAQSAEDASLLARYWGDIFPGQVQDLIADQFAAQRAMAEQTAEDLVAELADDGGALAVSDRDVLLSSVQIHLRVIQEELVESETQFRTLTRYSITVDEARLGYLESALAEESPTLAGSASDGNTASEAILNPVYQQLSQDLADTRIRLAVSRYRAGLLEASIPQLQDEIYQLNEAIVLYQPAKALLDRLLEMEAGLSDLSQPVVVTGPSKPQTPASRGTIEIMALVGTLSALIGLLVVYFFEWYRIPPHSSSTKDESRPT